MCEKGTLNLSMFSSVRIPKIFKYGIALSLLQAKNMLRTHLFCFSFNLKQPGLVSTTPACDTISNRHTLCG